MIISYLGKHFLEFFVFVFVITFILCSCAFCSIFKVSQDSAHARSVVMA